MYNRCRDAGKREQQLSQEKGSEASNILQAVGGLFE